MEFTFLGTGTSQGVPVIACTCPVCLSTDPLDKRLRSSVLLRSETTSVVIDTGPDFRYQMLREGVTELDAIIFTHQHKDHTAGLDDVRAFNYAQKRSMPVYATLPVQAHLRQEFAYIFDQPNYPGVPQLDFHTLAPDSTFTVGDLDIQPIPLMHGQLPVLGFRCGNFAYLTDTNHIPATSLSLLEGLDILVLDALRREPHHSHFTLAEAIEAATHIGAKRTFFTHISHLMGRHASTSQELPANMHLAYDGLKVYV